MNRFTAGLDKGTTSYNQKRDSFLKFPIADPLYSMFHHSHPTFLERVHALAATKKRDYSYSDLH